MAYSCLYRIDSTGKPWVYTDSFLDGRGLCAAIQMFRRDDRLMGTHV